MSVAAVVPRRGGDGAVVRDELPQLGQPGTLPAELGLCADGAALVQAALADPATQRIVAVLPALPVRCRGGDQLVEPVPRVGPHQVAPRPGAADHAHQASLLVVLVAGASRAA